MSRRPGRQLPAPSVRCPRRLRQRSQRPRRPPPPSSHHNLRQQPPESSSRFCQVFARGTIGFDAFSPSFGRQGDLLFHVRRNAGAVMRASFNRDGTPTLSVLVDDHAANYHPSLSPDGAWLAYDSDRDGTRGVYVAHADGTNPKRVSGEGYAAVPRWSPDGRRLSFIRAERQRPRTWNVWVLDRDTGEISQVSRHRVGQAWSASWFPDGEHVAYSVEDRLVIAGVQSGTTRVLRSPRRGRLVRTPAVSPDGRWIVFQVFHDGIWLAEVETGAMHRLAADPAAEEFAWSPDVREVVYHTKKAGVWSLWRVTLGSTIG
jgi:Tol biopolymer transport system component